MTIVQTSYITVNTENAMPTAKGNLNVPFPMYLRPLAMDGMKKKR